jgi:hypothetical protein
MGRKNLRVYWARLNSARKTNPTAAKSAAGAAAIEAHYARKMVCQVWANPDGTNRELRFLVTAKMKRKGSSFTMEVQALRQLEDGPRVAIQNRERKGWKTYEVVAVAGRLAGEGIFFEGQCPEEAVAMRAIMDEGSARAYSVNGVRYAVGFHRLAGMNEGATFTVQVHVTQEKEA